MTKTTGTLDWKWTLLLLGSLSIPSLDCGSSRDATGQDASQTDGFVRDAAADGSSWDANNHVRPDAARRDATTMDAASLDAKTPDARIPDAAGQDATIQVDSGPTTDACQPVWRDTTACACTPSACASCTGTKEQRDGCGHVRQTSCTLPASGCPTGQSCNADGACVITVTNPIMQGDLPDPDVLRLEGTNGQVTYYLVHTIGAEGDIPVYRSTDLVHWDRLSAGAFAQQSTPGTSLDFPNGHFCHIWAPDLTAAPAGGFMLSFTATRWTQTQTSCPGTSENSGVYLASSTSPSGPYAVAQHPWEPFPAGANPSTCASSTTDALPHSVDYASGGCQNNYCHKIIRLDSDTFHDPQTGKWWLSYAWYTNIPPLTTWERDNYGEHVGIVELDPADPYAVKCDTNTPQIFLANCHDTSLLNHLAASCPRCDEMLSFTKGRFGEEVVRNGYSWGVVEAPNLFRRGSYVYALMSGSMWDSPYYHVFWVAAPSVEQLAYDSGVGISGRFLIPSLNQAFGHGTAVLGPDGQHWYYVHHRLDSSACQNSGNCSRDLWITPITFEDKGDGLGPVHIKPVFPAEHPTVEIIQSGS